MIISRAFFREVFERSLWDWERLFRTCLGFICTKKDTFQQAILQLPVWWKKCILASGDYFEGDHISANLEVVEMGDSQDEEEKENFDSDSSQ